MAIDSDDLFSLALRLSNCEDEASRRAAISRAYYASYHRCLEWERSLPKLGDGVGVHGVHASLIRRLRRPHPSCDRATAKSSKDLGKWLDQQRQRRGIADYDAHVDVPVEWVHTQLASVRRLLGLCRAPAGSVGRASRRRR